MKLFNNMKIATKMIFGFIFISIIAGVVGIVGIMNLKTLDENNAKLYEYNTVPIAYTVEITEDFQKLRVNVRDMVIETEKSKVEEVYKSSNNLLDNIHTIADEFEKLLLTDNGRTAFAQYKKSLSEYETYFGEYYNLCKENKDEEALAMLKGDWSAASDSLQASIDDLVNLKIEDAKTTTDSNSSMADNSTNIMIIIIVLGVAIAMVIGLFISSSISKPIKQSIIHANTLATGDFSLDVPAAFMERKDEIGELAQSFQSLTDSINDLMTNIKTASEQVAAGSKQISDSSIELSQGATEQASSIEELTASIEEIASQTKINANNAENANDLAVSAQKYADIGNEQMQHMLKSMNDINDSSNSISKIIKVIDDIAFQTNILALNAAVEAARAGQHGKGFAVVAEEVRNLAARSANAAKETTELIEGSINKVNQGTKIASNTAEELVKIVDGITKVADLINDISSASNEQAKGIEQINQGVIQISNVVQANSSTSQESAAASEELSGQAVALEEQISKFKIKNQKNYETKKTEKIEKNKEMKNLNISLSNSDFGKY